MRGTGLCLALALIASGAQAHEFWIEPQAHQIAPGDRIVADLRVGQMMKGRSYPYLSPKFVSYTVTDQTGTRPVRGNEGDSPSVNYEAKTPGLHILAYDAKPERVTFDEFQTFSEYLQEEGHGHVISRHRERGLPESGFTETYTRNAKALIQVGPPNPADTDQATGLTFELIARENPYAVAGKDLPVTLLWKDKPAANAQIAIFQKTGPDKVDRRTVRTDADGNATISLAGGGQFLLSAVHIDEAPAESGTAWQSTWASLTFGLQPAQAE